MSSPAPNPTAGRNGSSSRRRDLAAWLLLLSILGAGLALRAPFLYNAAENFNSDEAVNALVLKHMAAGGGLAFNSWDTHYYGVVEGLLAIPFVALYGYRPLAFKLGALVGFAMLLVAVFLLGRRLFGRRRALLACALVAVFSSQLLQWSAVASVGYTLITAWGTLTVLAWDGLRRRVPPRGSGEDRQAAGAGGKLGSRALWRVAALGLMCGFGLYIYQLYLVYLAALAAAWLPSSFAWRWLRAADESGRQAARRDAGRQLPAAVAFLAGFAAGWSPTLATLASGAASGKQPAYGLADWARMVANARLLVGECIPALFGFPQPRELQFQPALSLIVALLLALVLAVYGGAWWDGARRVSGELAGILRRPPGEIGTEALIVLLVPLTALLFVLSRNPSDVMANRFLLPWLTSLPLLAGASIDALFRRSRAAGGALLLLLLGGPMLGTVRWYQWMGYLDASLRLHRARAPLPEVVSFLQRSGLRGGYGDYWSAYSATFLSGETLVIAPYHDWDRYPAYSRYVDGLPAEAYVFDFHSPPAGDAAEELIRHLRAAGARPMVRQFGHYWVFASRRPDRRLLPVRVVPRPLSRPRAAIAAPRVPAVARRGELLEIPLSVTNLGAEGWSAQGLAGSGVYRVAVSYRWLNQQGVALPGEGRRTLLPADVAPGASLALVAEIPAPTRPGGYHLLLTLVQEGVAWFDQVGGGAAVYAVRVPAALPAPADLRTTGRGGGGGPR